LTRTIDTRFFISLFTADTDEVREKSRRTIHELERESAILPTIVIHEVYKYVYQHLGRDTADLRLRLILNSGLSPANLDVEIAKRSAELRCKYSDLPTSDAIIAATSIMMKSFKVVTDDPHFSVIKEIKVEWL
jgi:predicted nucleic acid-binding protein